MKRGALWIVLVACSDPSDPAVPRAPFARTWTDRPVALVGLGESITAGFGASPGRAYFDRLVKDLAPVFPKLASDNRSVSSSTSDHCLEIQIASLPSYPKDVLGWVVMTTGGNDIIHNYGRGAPREFAMYGAMLEQAKPWIRAYEARLDAMIRQISAKFAGGCRIFLANIYDPTDGVGDIENAGLPAWKDGLAILAAYNDVIRRCAQKHEQVHLIDLHSTFMGHGIHNRYSFWYYTNLEDPNDQGYDAIRRLFLLEMIRAADAGAKSPRWN